MQIAQASLADATGVRGLSLDHVSLPGIHARSALCIFSYVYSFTIERRRTSFTPVDWALAIAHLDPIQ
jgi:hypothetical protein